MNKLVAVLGTSALLAGFVASPAGATNGMDMIGFGSRAIGMGGADVAVAGDAGNISGNPAAVSAAAPSSANIGITVLKPTLTLTHNTPSGPDTVDGEAQYFPLPQLGYVKRVGGGPLAIGIGAYYQGGMGVDFTGLDTGMGTRDELTSQIKFLRVNPLLSWAVNDSVTLGATVMLGYADARFSFYPETYSAGMDGTPGTGDDFAGMDVTGLGSPGYAGRVGAQVRVGPMIRLGAMYTSESTIKLEGGTARLNFGQMKVDYDAALEDFTWPQEVEAGVAITPAKGLTVAADVKWINWSAAIDRPILKISNPDRPVPMTSREIAFDMGWEDQWVYAIGVEYAINETHTLRAGYNYGKNPIPDDKLNPIFPAIVEQHMTLGYGLAFGRWAVNLAYEHAFEGSRVNDNADRTVNNFGPGLKVDFVGDVLSLDATYRY